MFNKISSLLEEDDEPPSRVEKIIQDIQQALNTLATQIEAIEITATANQNKLRTLNEQSDALQVAAKRAYKNKETSKAQSLWEELKIVGHKVKQYEQLQGAIDQSRIKLQQQRNELEFKQDQLQAKMKVGELDANASKNYAEIMESLMLLKNSGELSQYKEAIAAAEYKAEALKELTNDPNPSSVEHLDDLEQLIEEEKQASNQKTLDQLQLKYGSFFENATNETSRPQDDRLEDLASQSVAPIKADKFFDKEDTVPKSSEQADRIKNFFGK